MRRPLLLSGAVTPWVDKSPRGTLTPQEEAAVQARVAGIIGHESRGNPRAQNRRSTAGGLGQFIDDTWLQYARKVNPALRNVPDAQVLSLKKNASPEGVAFQRQVLNDFTRDNAIRLKNAGLPINAATLYSVHFSGDTRLAEAAAHGSRATVGQILGRAAARANPTLANLSAPAFMQRFGKEPGGAQIAQNGSVDPSRSLAFRQQFGGAPAPVQTAAASPMQIAQPRLDPTLPPVRSATTLLTHLSPVGSAVAAPAFQPAPPRPAQPPAPPPAPPPPAAQTPRGSVRDYYNPKDPSGPLLSAPRPQTAPPPVAPGGTARVTVSQPASTPAAPPPARPPTPPQAPLPPMANNAPRALPASLAGAPQPQIQPAARPQAQLGPMHVGTRSIGPAAPPQAPLPPMANNAPRALPANMAGAMPPRVTPSAPPAPRPAPAPRVIPAAAPAPRPAAPPPSASPRFSAGGELRGNGDAAFRRAYQESLQRPAQSRPVPVAAPAATQEQIARPKMQPTKGLSDAEVAAAVGRQERLSYANGYPERMPPAPPAPPAPQQGPRPEYSDPMLQRQWESRPAFGTPGVTPQVPLVRDVAATPMPRGQAQLPPIDIGRPHADPNVTYAPYQPATPQLAPMTPDPTQYQPVTTPISTPAVDPGVFPTPTPVTPPSTSPGPTFTPDPGPSMGDNMPTVIAPGGGADTSSMFDGLADALSNLGGGGEGAAQPPSQLPQGMSAMAAMASVPDFPRIGDQYGSLLNQRGAQADMPIGLPQAPAINLKPIGQAGMQPGMDTEGFARPALKRLFTA